MSLRAGALFLGAVVCLMAQSQSDSSEIRIGVTPYTPIPTATFSAETRLVGISVLVRDSHDRPVSGLTKADFAVYDSNQLQKIASFSADDPTVLSSGAAPMERTVSTSAAGPRPKRFVAVVIDDLIAIPFDECGGQIPMELMSYLFAATNHMKAPAEALFEENRRSGDQTAIFGFWVGQVTPFQSDATVLRQALDRMTIHRLCTDIDVKLRTLEDIEDFLATLAGERSILLASPVLRGSSVGILGSTPEVNRVIAKAVKYGITINTLNAYGLVAAQPQPTVMGRPGAPNFVAAGSGVNTRDTRPKPDMVNILGRLADGTGGTYIHDSNDFTGAMKDLGETPSGSYRLEIVPDQAQDGRYHALKVKTTAAHRYSVKARPGYYAEEPKNQGPSPETRLSEAVAGSEIRQELPATFAVGPPKPGDSPEQLTVILSIDMTHFPFPKENGRRRQQLTMIAALTDDGGNYVMGGKGSIVMDLKENAYADLVKRGQPLSLEMKLGASPGHYQLRTVLREDATNRMTTASQVVAHNGTPEAARLP